MECKLLQDATEREDNLLCERACLKTRLKELNAVLAQATEYDNAQIAKLRQDMEMLHARVDKLEEQNCSFMAGNEAQVHWE